MSGCLRLPGRRGFYTLLALGDLVGARTAIRECWQRAGRSRSALVDVCGSSRSVIHKALGRRLLILRRALTT